MSILGRRSIKRYLLIAVVVPLAGRLAIRLSETLEARSGQTSTTRRLRQGGALLARRRPPGGRPA